MYNLYLYVCIYIYIQTYMFKIKGSGFRVAGLRFSIFGSRVEV